MANEIIYKIQVDGTQENVKNLNLLQDALNELGRQKTSLSKESKDLAKALEEVNAASDANNKKLKALNAAYKEGRLSNNEYEVALKGINQTATQNAVELDKITKRQQDVAAAQVQNKLETKELTAEFRANEKAIKDNATATNSQEGSIESLRVALRQSQQEFIKLSKAERENDQVGGKLLRTIQEQDKELKELESSIGINQRSVGDYGKAVQGTLPLLGGFGAQIQQILGTLGEIKTAFMGFAAAQKASTAATNGGSKALRIFKVALASTGIGALVIAVGALVTALLSSQKGIEGVQKVMSALGATVNVIRDRLIKVGGAIASLFQGDFTGAAEQFKEATSGVADEIARETREAYRLRDALIQVEKQENNLKLERAATRAQIKELNLLAEDTTKGYEERANAARQAINIEQQLLDKQINTQKQRAANILGLMELTDEKLQDIRENGLKLEDVGLSESTEEDRQAAIDELAKIFELQEQSLELQTTLNNKLNTIEQQRSAEQQKRIETLRKQREDAEKEAQKAAEDRAKNELEAINKEIDLKAKTLELEFQLEQANTEMTAEMKFQKELELQEKLNALRIEKAKANNENLAEVELENQVKEAELRAAERERLAEEQAEIDAEELERIEEQEQLIADKKKEIRSAAIEAVDMVSNAFFDNQNRRIDQETKREVEALNLRRQAGEISEQEFEKKREQIDRKAFERQKRADTARAVINGALAVTKAFADAGYPAGLVTAALAAIQTGIQISTIQAQQFAEGGFTGNGFGAPDSTGFKPAGIVHEGEYVVPKSVLQTEQGGRLVGQLESMRKNKPRVAAIGFANGGMVPSVSVNPDLKNIEEKIVMGVTSAVQSIKVENVATETATVANRVQQIQDSSSF